MRYVMKKMLFALVCATAVPTSSWSVQVPTNNTPLSWWPSSWKTYISGLTAILYAYAFYIRGQDGIDWKRCSLGLATIANTTTVFRWPSSWKTYISGLSAIANAYAFYNRKEDGIDWRLCGLVLATIGHSYAFYIRRQDGIDQKNIEKLVSIFYTKACENYTDAKLKMSEASKNKETNTLHDLIYEKMQSILDKKEATDKTILQKNLKTFYNDFFQDARSETMDKNLRLKAFSHMYTEVIKNTSDDDHKKEKHIQYLKNFVANHDES